MQRLPDLPSPEYFEDHARGQTVEDLPKLKAQIGQYLSDLTELSILWGGTPMEAVISNLMFETQRVFKLVGKESDRLAKPQPDEEPHYSCTRHHCQEDDPANCWAQKT